MYILRNFFIHTCMPVRPRTWRAALATTHRVALMLLLIIIIVACSVPAGAVDCTDDATLRINPSLVDTTSTTDLFVLDLLSITDTTSSDHATALLAGVSAALHDSKYTTSSNRALHVISPADPTTVTGVDAFINYVMQCDFNILAGIGPFSDASVTKALSGITNGAAGSAQSNLLLIGPYTSGSAIRQWNPNLYFLRAEPLAEVAVLVRYLLINLAVKRIGVMYLQGATFGDTEAQRVNELLSGAGRGAATVYAPRYTDSKGALTTLDETVFQKFAQTLPEAILVFGMPGDHTRSFIRRCLTDPQTSGAVILATQATQYDLATVVTALAASGELPDTLQLFASGTNAPTSETNLSHIAAFQAQMTAYIDSGDSPYAATVAGQDPIYLTDSKVGELQVMGWLVGQVLMQMVGKEAMVSDAAHFVTGAFNQARYIVGDDYVLGDFGGVCVGEAGALGAACQCNQGGRTTTIKTMDSAGEIARADTPAFTYAGNVCYSANQTLPTPLIVAVLVCADDPVASLMVDQMKVGLDMLSASTASGQSSAAFATQTRQLATTRATAEQVLAQADTDYYLDVFLGPLEASIVPSSIVVLGPMFIHPMLRNTSANLIYVMATIEQQTYIMYEYAELLQRKGAIGKSDVTVLARAVPSAELAGLQNLLNRTAAAFDMPAPTCHVLDADTDASALLAPSGLNLFLGFGLNDVRVAYDFLKANGKAYILTDYTSYATAYTALLAAFTSSAANASTTMRFSATTSLPQWNKNTDAGHAESALLTSFHAAVPDASQYTPRALEAYVLARLVASLGSLTSLSRSGDDATAASVQEAFYHGSVYYVNDHRVGPYTDCSLLLTSNCESRNFGANKVGVLSFAGIFDLTRGFELSLMEPRLNYTVTAVDKPSITTGQIVGIAVGCAAFVAVLVSVGIIIFCCCFDDSRDNKNAPKNLCDPVTLVFTDIESSTAMWAACPTIMPDAVATHHRLIRQLIASYKCYEVKTIGDSFMIACKSPSAAVMVARGIQTKFLKHDWKTTAIDDAYKQFELQKEEEEEGYLVRSAHLTPEEYDKVWHGLRVRVGIHTGLSDIRQDEITKGYDYYGDTSNMAARTEAIANGGQVIMTGSTWWALSQSERDMFRCTNFGPQGLRGVPYGVEMFQLEVISNRIYGDLRTEIELEFDDEVRSSNSGGGGNGTFRALESLAGTMTRGANAVAAVLTSCFCVYPTRQRVKELQPLLVRWGISVPERRHEQNDLDDYCRLLINLVALKIASVTEAQMRIPETMDHFAPAPAFDDELPRLARSDRQRDSVEMTAIFPFGTPSVSVEEGHANRHNSEPRRSGPPVAPSEVDFSMFNGLSLWRQAHGRSRRSRRTNSQSHAVADPDDDATRENPLTALSSMGAHLDDEDGQAAQHESAPVFKRIPMDMLEIE